MIRLHHRSRVTIAIMLVSLAIAAILASTLYVASERLEQALVEQLVGEEMDFLIQRYQTTPDYTPGQRPNVGYFILDSATGDQASLPYELRNLEQGHNEIFIASFGGERDIFIRDVGTTRFVVVYDIGPYEIREQKFRRLIAISILLALVLALVMGYLLSGLLTRQLSALAKRVENLVPNQPSATMTSSGQDREVAMLAMAFDKYHELFNGMIRREQDFTANVAHELRTPLTSIRTSCELLATDPALNPKSRSRIQFILHAVDSMHGHAQALLLLARGQQLSTSETIAVRECVEDVLSHFTTELQARNLSVEIEIATDAQLQANRQALQLVLLNLLKNAVNYTEAGFVRVKFYANSLVISDSGQGIPPEQLSMIFKRRFRGSAEQAGLGLGLDIVNRICSECGWRISVESQPGAGSAFTIAFP